MERHGFYSKTGTFTLPGGVFELSGMTSLQRMPEHREHGEEYSAQRGQPRVFGAKIPEQSPAIPDFCREIGVRSREGTS